MQERYLQQQWELHVSEPEEEVLLQLHRKRGRTELFIQQRHPADPNKDSDIEPDSDLRGRDQQAVPP